MHAGRPSRSALQAGVSRPICYLTRLYNRQVALNTSPSWHKCKTKSIDLSLKSLCFVKKCFSKGWFHNTGLGDHQRQASAERETLSSILDCLEIDL